MTEASKLSQKSTSEEPSRKFLQEEFLENISDEIRLNGHYLILLFFSTIIATLGLLINSAAVVIGAMLISPLFWPILGVTLSIISNRRRLARRSALNLFVSVLLVLVVGFLLAKISPLAQITTEISSRTNPTLLDLFIALAASVIGVLAIYDARISQSTSGVAISIALLPALCVSGIGIAFGSWEIFIGSLLLFSANIGAIIFVGVLTLYLLKFRPRDSEDQTRFKWGLAASFVFLLLLSLPLSYFFQQTIRQNTLTSQINTILEEEIHSLNNESRLENLRISFPQRFSSNLVQIEATVYLSEGNSFTTRQRSLLINRLSDSVSRDIDLKLNLVNSLVLKRAEDEEIRELREQIRSMIITTLSKNGRPLTFETIDITFPEDEKELISVLLIMKDNSLSSINYSEKIQLEKVLEDKFQRDFLVEVEFIPITRLSESSDVALLETRIGTLLEERLSLISDKIKLNRYHLLSVDQSTNDERLSQAEASTSAVLGIQSAQAVVYIEVPEDYLIEDDLKVNLEVDISKELNTQLSLEIYLIRYETL